MIRSCPKSPFDPALRPATPLLHRIVCLNVSDTAI
jgi:hypothetical protein